MIKAILDKNLLSYHSTPSLIHHRKGFTLIELAIILVVIGILIALGAGLVGILTKQAKLPFKTHTSQVQEKLG